MMAQPNQPGGRRPEMITYGGRAFEIDEDAWVEMEPGNPAEDHYMITVVYVCCSLVIQVSYVEKDDGKDDEAVRARALESACAELLALVQSHEARCATCQADIVAGLFRPRWPRHGAADPGDQGPETEEG